ncbi:MAG: hypothetical protein JST16_02005 [Bdellovibrionales bacterium]|nr:hypothetical protein [Bdellovibrionales bacterium]
MTNREVTYSKSYSNILGAVILVAGALLALPSQAQQSASSFSIGAGFNYNSGNNYGYYPYPAYGGGMYPGYGSAYYSGGYLPNYMPGGYIGGMGGFGGYTPSPNFNPGPIARPLGQVYPYLPAAQMYGNMGYGVGYGSYPGLGYAPTGNCIPCGAGLQQTPIYPVQGGPAVTGSCGAVSCGPQSGAGNGYANAGYNNGMTVIDMSDHTESADLNWWAIGAAVGANSSITGPIAIPRNNNTSLANPTFYNTGARGYDFYARPHGP